MNKLIIIGFAKLVKNGRISISQVPAEHVEAVKAYLAGKDVEDAVSSDEATMEEMSSVQGAIHLDKLDGIPLNVENLQSGKTEEIVFHNEKIFTPEVLKQNAFPVDLQYSIERVENAYGRFQEDPNVQIGYAVGGFLLKISGTPVNVSSTDTMLRVDLKIRSMNYEDMRLMIYFVSN